MHPTFVWSFSQDNPTVPGKWLVFVFCCRENSEGHLRKILRHKQEVSVNLRFLMDSFEFISCECSKSNVLPQDLSETKKLKEILFAHEVCIYTNIC